MSDIVSIDGPASSGKTSVGFLFSRKVGYAFIDSGYIYRALCYKILKTQTPLTDLARLVELCKSLQLDFKVENLSPQIYLECEKITQFMHQKSISEIVAQVAAIPEVRIAAKLTQRQAGESQNTVMIGRDIGTAIFPDARTKFFLTASLKTRAKRRFEQLKKSSPGLTLEQVTMDTKKRDEMDTNRQASPMRIASGAIVVDTTNKTIEETVSTLLLHFSPL